MVYKKKYYKNSAKGRAPLTKGQYRTVKKIANKQIHKMSELHTIDEAPVAKAMTTLALETPSAIKFPVQGLKSSERIGDSIYLRSVNFRSILNNESDVDLVARVCFFQWMEPSEDPVVADIFANVARLTSPYKTNPQKKFKILHDSFHVWDSNANSKGKRLVNLTFKGKDFTIHKPDFEAIASEVATGRIWYFIASDTADTGVIDEMYTRVRYFDN